MIKIPGENLFFLYTLYVFWHYHQTLETWLKLVRAVNPQWCRVLTTVALNGLCVYF